MDQVTNVKVQFRLEQWKKLIAECQNSGMPIRKWCEQHGFREQTYYYYLKKLREKEIEQMPTSLIPVSEGKPAVFKQLEVQSPIAATKAAVIIRLGNATVEVSEGTSQQTIQAVLLALQSVC